MHIMGHGRLGWTMCFFFLALFQYNLVAFIEHEIHLGVILTLYGRIL